MYEKYTFLVRQAHYSSLTQKGALSFILLTIFKMYFMLHSLNFHFHTLHLRISINYEYQKCKQSLFTFSAVCLQCII